MHWKFCLNLNYDRRKEIRTNNPLLDLEDFFPKQ